MLLLIVLATLLEVSYGYFVLHCGNIQTGRIDPIVSFGKVAGHAHTLAGATNIDVDSNWETLQRTACTSCPISADKSVYWTPQLYYHMANGGFIEVPHVTDETTIYYLGRTSNQSFEAFPPGFRMLAGHMTARSYDNATTVTNDTQLIADWVSFGCIHGGGVDDTVTPGLAGNTQCALGLRAQLNFQDCWNGKDLYLPDNSHVAYASDAHGCPPGYPHHFPMLFFEVLYNVQAVDQSDGGRFVFAQGDPTGYGFHGDFLNGWDYDVLSAAVAGGPNSCVSTSSVVDTLVTRTSSGAPVCKAFQSESVYNTSAPQCPSALPIFNERVKGNVGASLPGCNDVTDGPGPAMPSNNACPAGGNNSVPPRNAQPNPISSSTPSSSLPSATSSSAPNPGPTYNARSAGCASDTVGARSLTGATYVDTRNMTNDACQAFCFGKRFSLAGTEYAQECFCGNSLANGGAYLSNGQGCSTYCTGNSLQICGGSNRLSVFANIEASAPGGGGSGSC